MSINKIKIYFKPDHSTLHYNQDKTRPIKKRYKCQVAIP